MMEILALAVIVGAFAAGAISQYKEVEELENRILRLERTIWK